MSLLTPHSFQLIPVLDLREGIVVHAQRGDRQAYQPLRSTLCSSSEPLQIAQALLKLHPFQQFYIADLDAIEKRGSHRSLIVQLCTRHPGIQWWVDDGSTTPWPDKPRNLTQVLGTESSPDLQRFHGQNDFVLSLDQRDGELLGDAQLHADASAWPKRVIAMTLSEVGAASGPNFEVLKRYLAQHPEHDWYASGGVRHLDDLLALKALGAKGVLIATALHQAHITGNDLLKLL